MKAYTYEEIKGEIIGPIGTQERDEYERELTEELHAYHLGEAIKWARKEKHLTQEQLGELMGVKRAQISRIEKGKNLNFTTVARAFKAMNIPAKLAFGRVSLSLW